MLREEQWNSRLLYSVTKRKKLRSRLKNGLIYENNYFAKQSGFECIPLANVIKQHRAFLRRAKSNNSQNLNDYYIFADYIPPDKQEIIIDFNSGFGKTEDMYYMETVVPFRDGDLPIKQKRVKKCMVLRTFHKNNSVFKNWKEDTQKSLKESFYADISYSKVQKFAKEPEVYDEVCEVLLKHTAKIKDMFTYGIGTSSYPSISWLDFCNMCQQWKIIDKNLTMTTIDRVFIVTNVELEEQEDNPDRDLCRYEFYEIVARLAKEKYHTPKICDSIAESIDRFVDEIYATYEPRMWSWQKWREEQLWTVKIDDLLKANLEALTTVYSLYHTSMKKYMTLEDAIDLMEKCMPEISDGIVKLAYCYCKMTIFDEMKEKERYEKLEFVEFLEFIGRIASTLSPTDSKNKLFSRIEKVLQRILSVISEKIKYSTNEQDLLSESDSEPYKH